MSLDFINELEQKVDALIGAVTTLRGEKEQLLSDISGKDARIAELESECGRIGGELDSIKNDAAGRQGQIDTAADRIRGLLSRLEGIV